MGFDPMTATSPFHIQLLYKSEALPTELIDLYILRESDPCHLIGSEAFYH